MTLLLLIAVSFACLRATGATLTGGRLVAMAIGSGALVGAIALRLIKRRLAFHAGETPFAADALNKSVARAYLFAWLGSALVAAGLLCAIVSWRALPPFTASFLIGAALAGIIPEDRHPALRSFRPPAKTRTVRLILAILVTPLLWFAMTRLQGGDRFILSTLLLLFGIQVLAPLNARSLRFEGLSGVSLVSSLRRHLGPAASWYGVALLICGSQKTAAGLMPFAIGGGVLLVHVGRMLACRVTSERIALLIVSGILLLCGTIVALSPGYEWLAIPVGLSGLFWLFLRAMRDRWLIA